MPESPSRRGHKRANSEITFPIGSAFEKEPRTENRDFERDSVKELDLERELNPGREDLAEDMVRLAGVGRGSETEMGTEKGTERWRRSFWMYINMEKINSFSNSGGAFVKTERNGIVRRTVCQSKQLFRRSYFRACGLRGTGQMKLIREKTSQESREWQNGPIWELQEGLTPGGNGSKSQRIAQTVLCIPM
ncbi:hypothetical protein R1sor_006153 [Riccia sorocarpa]|uniref:Uncharacterized protein n=1 Tax=Riccia sorocarpa TaxID=122646 RepID=A0ABD3HQ42_9MARC